MPWSKENLPDAVKGKNWTDAQIEAFVKQANAILEESGDEGIAIATAIKTVEEKTNSKQLPVVYYAKHMETGAAEYENERILIDTDALKDMVPSFNGKPVYVGHQVVDIENLQETADGYISDSFYNELDGWLWVKFVAVSDKAHKAIADGWSVSNAYVPTSWGGPGTHHNVSYDRQITGAYFTHLALVPDPRYEEACIMSCEDFKAYQKAMKTKLEEIHNSKEEKTNMFKIFQTKREEVASLSPDSMIELRNGKTVTFQELLNASDDMEKKYVELENKYNALLEEMEAKKNSEATKTKEEESKEEEAKENEGEEVEKEEEDEKTNSKHFEELRNANKNIRNVVDTPMDMLTRGKSRYGSGQ